MESLAAEVEPPASAEALRPYFKEARADAVTVEAWEDATCRIRIEATATAVEDTAEADDPKETRNPACPVEDTAWDDPDKDSVIFWDAEAVAETALALAVRIEGHLTEADAVWETAWASEAKERRIFRSADAVEDEAEALA